MIKSLSPFNVTTSWISGITGLTCISYTLEIFVWNGSKANSGLIPTYSVQKDNLTTSTGDDIVNIARLVNDFLRITPQQGTTTEAIAGGNQVWVKTQVKYTTSNASELNTPQNVEVDLLLKGYGYGMEGSNTSAPTNKIHLQGTEFKVARNNIFSVPILIDETPSTLNAVADTINIFYQETNLLVLANDNLGFQPTNIILVTTSMPEAVGTLAIVGDVIVFTEGTGLVTPQTFDYTIEDATGVESIATVTLNLTALPATVTAVDDYYELNETDITVLDVMANDSDGTPPTTITTVVQTGITSGVITITNGGADLTFTPNGIIPTSNETFTYTIEDSLASTDQATVTLQIRNSDNKYLVRYANFGTVQRTMTGTYSGTSLPFSFVVLPNDIVDVNACVIESSLNNEPNVAPIFDLNINC